VSEARKSHWQRVYRDKQPTDVSWYQPVPEKSLQFIAATGITKTDPILDAGGGASTLVDHLLAAGYTDVSVLDISGAALERSQVRLDSAAAAVQWIEGDVMTFSPSRPYALWHDRAVFHFLTDPAERDNYIDAVRKALRRRGHLIIATFGPEGPLRCSGLEIQRYDIDRQQQWFGAHFDLRAHELDVHETPAGSSQQFLYSWWQLRD
jgi:SAM-dependent methyltransferase